MSSQKYKKIFNYHNTPLIIGMSLSVFALVLALPVTLIGLSTNKDIKSSASENFQYSISYGSNTGNLKPILKKKLINLNGQSGFVQMDNSSRCMFCPPETKPASGRPCAMVESKYCLDSVPSELGSGLTSDFNEYSSDEAPISASDVAFGFTPAKADLYSGSEFSTNLTLNTGDKKVTAIDAVLNYSGKLNITSVTALNSFPQVLSAPVIDSTNNKIKFILGSGTGNSVSGTVDVVTIKGVVSSNSAITVNKQTKVSALSSTGNVLKGATQFKLTVSANSFPGDLDKNGKVDIFDYNILLENFGKVEVGNVADINKDGKVDIFDYNILLGNFGKDKPTPTGNPTACGINNCHGLTITCGRNVPVACTEMYQVGDRCRQYASCRETNNQCQPVLSDAFNMCKSCVQSCISQFPNNPISQSRCEANCGVK